MSLSNINTNSYGAIFFSLIFIFWNTLSLMRITINHYLYSIGYYPYNIEYEYLFNAIMHSIIFFIFLWIGIYYFNKKNKLTKKLKYPTKQNYLILIIILAINIYIVTSVGFILFSSDYFSRFESNFSSNYQYFCVGLLYIYFNNLENQKIEKGYNLFLQLFILCLIIILNLLTASRNFSFQIIIGLLILYFSKSQINLLKIKNILLFYIFFMIPYLAGQFINVVRWYGIDFNLADIVLQFSSDSFNELASYEQVLEKLGINSFGKGVMELDDFLYDLISRLVPSFIYKCLELNRLDYYNQSWLVLEPIIYGTNDALFGIRIGLVGNIHVLLGSVYVPIWGIFYAWLLTRSTYHAIITLTCVSSIAYGPIVIFYLLIGIAFINFYKLFKIIMQKNEKIPVHYCIF
jgi:hypothetical protein